MKRPLLVFAGQSNMLGAAVLPAKEPFSYRDSYEYLHKRRRFGYPTGEWKQYAYPTGEFSYRDLKEAYGECTDPSAKSHLAYGATPVLFGAPMLNLLSEEEKSIVPFDTVTEASNHPMATSMIPYIVRGLEEGGYCSAFTQIAKGGVQIKYYLSGATADYFDEKARDFFAEAEEKFKDDDTSERVLIWFQGEGDAATGYETYKESLSCLWQRARSLGFTKFFIIRIDFWGKTEISEVMRAQEDFVKECQDAFMITRIASYFLWPKQETDGWFLNEPAEDCHNTRDSFFGYANNHINDKGHRVIARYAVPNMIRILFLNLPPILEEENIIPLL